MRMQENQLVGYPYLDRKTFKIGVPAEASAGHTALLRSYSFFSPPRVAGPIHRLCRALSLHP